MCLKEHQPAMSIDDQIENLKSIGLIIKDEDYAKAFLNDVSYFRLIKAYSLGLKVSTNGNYNDGVTFEEIVELYLFNANFRQLLFTQIERVEINLRCRIANYFSYKYGVLGYENASNFVNTKYHADFLKEINLEIKRNERSPFVKNFKNNYKGKKLPMYALIELFSFGALSKFYKNMKNEDKKEIAKIYGITYTYLESWFEPIAFVRNICAHYGRIYNINLSKTPKLYAEYSKISNVRVYATLICLKHLLPQDRHWREFIDIISELFDKYPHVKLKLMGFPTETEDEWKEYLC